MTPDEIRSKCRKVHLVITNNRIFANPDTGDERDLVPAFRTEELAETNRREYQEYEDMIRNAPEIYGRSKIGSSTRKTMAFYLVPASKIDE